MSRDGPSRFVTYKDGGTWHVCVLVEFTDGKISRETRYYAPPLEPKRA